MAAPLMKTATTPEIVNFAVSTGLGEWLRSEAVANLLDEVNRPDTTVNISTEAPYQPKGGEMFAIDRTACKYFRKDGHKYEKRGRGGLKECHEELTVKGVKKLNCYYSCCLPEGTVPEDATNPDARLHRRIYWLLGEDAGDVVLVHYLFTVSRKAGVARRRKQAAEQQEGGEQQESSEEEEGTQQAQQAQQAEQAQQARDEQQAGSTRQRQQAQRAKRAASRSQEQQAVVKPKQIKKRRVAAEQQEAPATPPRQQPRNKLQRSESDEEAKTDGVPAPRGTPLLVELRQLLAPVAVTEEAGSSNSAASQARVGQPASPSSGATSSQGLAPTSPGASEGSPMWGPSAGLDSWEAGYLVPGSPDSCWLEVPDSPAAAATEQLPRQGSSSGPMPGDDPLLEAMLSSSPHGSGLAMSCPSSSDADMAWLDDSFLACCLDLDLLPWDALAPGF